MQHTGALNNDEPGIFEGLTDADLAEIDDRFSMVTFRKGELVYSPYDRGDSLFVLESGRIRLYRSATDGRQLTLAILDPGMAFGQVSVLDEPTHDAYAEALSDCVVRVLRLSDLERAIGSHPRMALNLMRTLSLRLRHAEDQIESLAFRPGPSRLAAKLLEVIDRYRLATKLVELMDRYGGVTPTGIGIDERFTHLELHELIGQSRETLTKVLNEM